MKIDITNIDQLGMKEIETLHDQSHVLFNRLLTGGKIEYTFRELHYMHFNIYNALIRVGGKHISPIDQLDQIQMLEENPEIKKEEERKEDKKKEEFILLEYLDLGGTAKNLWAIQLEDKIFQLELNPLVSNILSSIKKNIDVKGNILDKGEFEILVDNENLLRVDFKGEKLAGIYNFKKNNEQSDVWILSTEGANEEITERFGESLSNEEINKIHFLSSNKVGVSEIANLMTRPVQTIYSWIGKLKK